MCSGPPGCHRSALKRPRGPIIIHNLSRSSWIIVDYHDELLRRRLEELETVMKKFVVSQVAGYATKACWSHYLPSNSSSITTNFPVFCFLPQAKALKQNHKEGYSSSQYRLQRKVTSPRREEWRKNSISSLHQLFLHQILLFRGSDICHPQLKTDVFQAHFFLCVSFHLQCNWSTGKRISHSQ